MDPGNLVFKASTGTGAVEEANFERVSNFGQKKGFLCELLLIHLSLCRYKKKFCLVNTGMSY